jgi:predicted metalloprotease
VVAHEIGHHVQTLVGTTQHVDAARRQATSKVEANQLSVALELQADCYAGLWANRATHQNLILDRGDLEEGLNAASAVGDDRIQKQSQGYVVPDAFTHGSSAQRVAWFRKGLESGEMTSCDCSVGDTILSATSGS